MLLDLKCRECGHPLKITEYGIGKLCPNCRKNTVTRNIKEIHINFSDTIYAAPDKLPRNDKVTFLAGIDYFNMSLCLNLTIGDISCPPQSNAYIYSHSYSSWKVTDRYITNQKNRLAQIGDDIPVYIWLNENDANGYLNLLFFAHLFNRFETVYLIRCCSNEEMKNDSYEPNDSFSRKKRITSDMLEAMSTEFLQIQKSGGDYRVGRYGEIKVYSKEKLQEIVLSQISDRYVNFNTIYTKVYDFFKAKTEYVIDYHSVEDVVWQLMIEKRIKSHGVCLWWGDNSHNNMLITQTFRKNKAKELSYKGDNEIEIIHDALKYGYTLPLYEIVAEDATLDFEGDTISVGKFSIIEFIENYGSERIHTNNEKVFCYIVKVAEGERYGVGDICNLVCYENQDGKKTYYLIKIQNKNGQIEKIKIFNTIAPLRLEAYEE